MCETELWVVPGQDTGQLVVLTSDPPMRPDKTPEAGDHMGTNSKAILRLTCQPHLHSVSLSDRSMGHTVTPELAGVCVGRADDRDLRVSIWADQSMEGPRAGPTQDPR